MKECKKCKIEQPLTEFKKDKGYTDGRRHQCNTCRNVGERSRWANRSDASRKLHQDRSRKWRYENRGDAQAQCAKYNASKDKRTPAWADLDAIRAIYKDCQAINRISLTRHEVDHIVPLRGEKVSGLHVAYNLQIIPAVENSSKGNTWQT
jgi:hypothetical protein